MVQMLDAGLSAAVGISPCEALGKARRGQIDPAAGMTPLEVEQLKSLGYVK